MDRELLAKLRREQVLRMLPDGREAVEITVQYTGEVPPLPRAERRTWLRDHFAAVGERVKTGHLLLEPDSISVSAQTMRGVVPLDELESVRRELANESHRVDLDFRRQVTDS